MENEQSQDVQLHLRVDDETKAGLQKLAAANDRKMTVMGRILLRKVVADELAKLETALTSD